MEGKTGNSLEYDRAGEERLESSLHLLASIEAKERINKTSSLVIDNGCAKGEIAKKPLRRYLYEYS